MYRLGIGNPVSHPSIKQYLKSVKEEQARTRSRPTKATPIFLGKLEKIAAYIFAQFSAPRVLPIKKITKKLANSPIFQ